MKSQIKDFLGATQMMMERCQPSARRGPVRWLLDHAQIFEVRHEWGRDVPLARGPMKECYRTCSNAVIDRSSRFAYCEGYALAIIPVMHAWVLDLKTGLAYDPTWKSGVEYFGVAFAAKYLRGTLVARETYGVIDNWEKGYPLLAAPLQEWRHADWPAVLAL